MNSLVICHLTSGIRVWFRIVEKRSIMDFGTLSLSQYDSFFRSLDKLTISIRKFFRIFERHGKVISLALPFFMWPCVWDVHEIMT